MSVKKTGSPLSSGSEPLEPLGSKNELRRSGGSGKVEKNFEAALAEVAGQIEQTGASGEASAPARGALSRIASGSDLNTPEGAMQAVRESARFLVNARLDDELRDSSQGKKMTDDLSEYIARDPFMHRKILNILHRLK
ncbi:MAG: hypothetical protein M3384_12205 [Acidobacteriota bacterium]|nr:hypothetical protein [Acidobacteriota bacterium]